MTKKPATFQSITYRRSDGGKYIRRCETVAESYHTEDGGYVPQRAIGVCEREVFTTDPEYQDAVEWVNDVDRPY